MIIYNKGCLYVSASADGSWLDFNFFQRSKRQFSAKTNLAFSENFAHLKRNGQIGKVQLIDKAKKATV